MWLVFTFSYPLFLQKNFFYFNEVQNYMLSPLDLDFSIVSKMLSPYPRICRFFLMLLLVFLQSDILHLGLWPIWSGVFCILYIYLLAVLCLCCCVGFSLVMPSGGYSLVVMHRLLILVGFSCEAQAPGLMGFSSCDTRVQQLQLPGSRV